MVRSLEEYLREHPEGVSAADAARDALLLSGPPALVAKLAEPALAGVPGAAKGPDGLWRIGATPDLPAIAAVVVADGPQPGIDAVLAVGLAAEDGVLFSVTGPVPDVDVADLAERIAASRIVVFDSGRYLPHLGVKPKAVTKLKPVLRKAERIEPSDGLAEAAAAFDVLIPESDDPGDTALAVARLWRAAIAAGLDPAAPPKPPAPFDFGSVGFGPELLEEIPDRPGVYRFFDKDGELLYVGKAKNLRQRVGSYFGHRLKRRKKHAELMERLHTLEWEESGSDLEALLAEQEGIRAERPSMNVQREVHDRGDGAGDVVLFLPGEVEGAVTLLLVRDGKPAGRVETDVRARGMREVRAAIGAAFYSPEPPEAGETADEDAGIIASWLRRQRDGTNWLDVTEVGGRGEAARRVKAWLTDPDLFTRKVWHR